METQTEPSPEPKKEASRLCCVCHTNYTHPRFTWCTDCTRNFDGLLVHILHGSVNTGDPEATASVACAIAESAVRKRLNTLGYKKPA
jgi:hypothetical protein